MEKLTNDWVKKISDAMNVSLESVEKMLGQENRSRGTKWEQYTHRYLMNSAFCGRSR
jgi:hypothetical protein